MHTTETAQKQYTMMLNNPRKLQNTHANLDALYEQAFYSRQTEEYCEYCSNTTAWD